MVTEEDIGRVADAVEVKLADNDRPEDPQRGDPPTEEVGQGLTSEEMDALADNFTLAPEAHKAYSEEAETVATSIREGDMDSALGKAIAFRDKVKDSSTCAVCEDLANDLLEDVAAAVSCALAGGECLEEKGKALKQAENVRDIFAPEPEADHQ